MILKLNRLFSLSGDRQEDAVKLPSDAPRQLAASQVEVLGRPARYTDGSSRLAQLLRLILLFLVSLCVIVLIIGCYRQPGYDKDIVLFPLVSLSFAIALLREGLSVLCKRHFLFINDFR